MWFGQECPVSGGVTDCDGVAASMKGMLL